MSRSCHRLATLFACSLSCALGAACDADTARPDRDVVACGFSHPESVTARGSRRFVSNVGAALDPTGKDGDGFISELDADGRIEELRAFEPLDAPKGLAIVGGRLFVADIDRVVGFDLDDHSQVFEARPEPAEARLLNDLVVEDDKHLLVSDTAAGALYRLNLDDGTFTRIASEIPGANGIAIDSSAERAYVVGVGADFSGGGLHVVELADGSTAQPIAGPFGILDGLALLSSGVLVMSDWVSIDPPGEATLPLYDVRGKSLGALDPGATLHGAADLYYDEAHEQLWIPQMIDGCVRAIDATP